jgi:hypothetical protein
VIRVGGETVAYVKKGSDLVPTPVEIGLDNNRMIQIKSGLEKGQVVSLAPPLSEASAAQEAGHSENSGVNMDEVRSSLEESKRLDAVRPQRPTGMNNGMGPDGAAGMPAGGMEDMRQRFQNMSQEERDAMRQRFENMSQEERDAMRQRMGGGAGGAGGAGRTGRGPRGGGAGMAPGGGGSPRGGSPMGGAR